MLSQKAIGAILYKYYLKNYCESDFSFDKCELRNKIDAYIANINKADINEIEKDIVFSEKYGSDYEYYEFSYPNRPELIVQVTSLIDYDGKKTGNYKGKAKYADVGLFLVDYKECDFDNLEE